ncbi:MAG: protein kinase [Oscillospiraceae bacterium]|nr:protein kinase [Oscillospiraceae bacterium]
MTIEKLKNMEPLFGSWYVDCKLSEGMGSKFFKVYKNEQGHLSYLGLKTVKFPSGDKEVSDVISSGKYRNMDEYLDALENKITENMNIMLSLRTNKNIVRYDNFTIVRESSCFYVLMLMELLTPLTDCIKLDNIAKGDVIKLGKDICCALEGFRNAGVMHHSIKPENIYIDSDGNYKLGDFGLCDPSMQGEPEASPYMAPELYSPSPLGDSSSDIYALGILMYKLLNNNRVPFLPAYPAPVSLSDRENAFAKCMRGEVFPTPAKADYSLSKIIFKATAFRPTERYFSPVLMSADLERYIPDDAPVYHPEPAVAASDFEIGTPGDIPMDAYSQNPEEYPDGEADDYYSDEEYDGDDYEQENVKDKFAKHWYYIVLALLVVLALIVAIIVRSGAGGKDETTTAEITTTEPTTAAPITTAPVTTAAPTTTEEATTEEETTTTEPSTTETTTAPTTTKPTTTNPTTTETTTAPTTEAHTTTEPYTEPTLVVTNRKNGDKAANGKTYMKISSYNLRQIPDSEFFDEVLLTIGDNLGENPTASGSFYIYQMAGSSLIQKVRADAVCETSEDFGGDLLCRITVDDGDFYYEPESYQYFLCFEEGAIESDSVITLPLQIRID